MMDLLRVFVLLVLTSSAHAGDWFLQVNGRSDHHGKAERELNEGNYGLGLQYNWESSGVGDVNFLAGGTLINSVEDRSWYAGGGKLWGLWNSPVDVGFIAGLIHYPSAEHPTFPAILPMVHVGNEWVGVNAMYIPEVTDEVTAATLYQLLVSLEF